MTQRATTRDYVRQSAVLTLAIAYPLSNFLPQVLGFGREVGENSPGEMQLLVPFEAAFSIWGLIFLGTLAAALVQALPSRRTMDVHRRTGWWWALAMALSCCWSIAESLSPDQWRSWTTALIFTPYVIAICVAMARFSWKAVRANWPERLCSAAIGLFAGWTSVAVFINWERIFTNELGLLTVELTALALLAASLGWVCWNLWRSAGNPFYAATAIWGLGFLAYDRLVTDDYSLPIAIAALVGIGLILLALWGGRKRRRELRV
ncbi:hypothetical protein [Aurantiacibacter gangjinensis]|uniref:hypothetical protein n=1 Tax=Aurantiacibacter gangjinensis TaxID=502682 RepID=UPI00069BA662|nr:hypothetical protein [Aurantiacibacter gangjinensis]APE29130.1 hypothetical protein BMF35_a2301 [Aurantiacibacter gangjinensis]